MDGDTYYLMALDQDGASAREKILELSDPEELLKTVAFTSNRPGRCQYLFLVPEQYAGVIKTRKFPTGAIGDADIYPQPCHRHYWVGDRNGPTEEGFT